MSYEIFADVSIDIDVSYKEKLRYIPMEYMIGEETFHCCEPESNEMMHNYYEKLRNKITTRTSQITPNHYLDVFEPFVKEGKEIIYLSLSSGLSNTYESACMAVKLLKENYDNVQIEIIDSLGATGGMGLLAEKACDNRDAGMSFSENAAWLHTAAGKICYSFKVEDLMYLQRGGRISAASAIVGTALKIKPILTVTSEGKLENVDKKRGNKQAMKSIVDRFTANYDPSYGSVVYSCCSDCMDDVDTLESMLLQSFPDLQVRKTMLSPIIGAHTGPDMYSLIYFGKER